MSLELSAALARVLTAEAQKAIGKLFRTVGGSLGLAFKPTVTRWQAEADAYAAKVEADAKNQINVAKEETKGKIEGQRVENQYALEDRAAERKDELAEQRERKRKLAAKRRTVQGRAAIRVTRTEVRQQKNLEAIVQQAALAITDQSKPVDDKPVDPDWTAFFLNQSQDISDEQMRSLWGRILTGEVSQPGSFSMRTLAVVRTMSGLLPIFWST